MNRSIIVTAAVVSTLAVAVVFIIFVFSNQYRTQANAEISDNEMHIVLSWSSNDMIKTTGATTRISLSIDPEGPRIKKIDSCKVSGDERIGGWLETDRGIKSVTLHIFIDHGTFQIPHPCNGRIRVRHRR